MKKLMKMENVQNLFPHPEPSEDPCITNFSTASGKHVISEWNFSDYYSDNHDTNGNDFKKQCTDFIEKVTITGDEISEIEIQTRGQSKNMEWIKYRCGRVTASKFGEIRNRRPTTAPDGLIRDIFQYNKNI